MEHEKSLLNGMCLTWTDNVRHLGNYMCSDNAHVYKATTYNYI